MWIEYEFLEEKDLIDGYQICKKGLSMYEVCEICGDECRYPHLNNQEDYNDED